MSLAATTIGIDRETFDLLEAVTDKRSEMLGLKVTKASLVRSLVLAEATKLGLYKAKPVSVRRPGPGPTKARKDPSRPRRGER